MTRPRLRPDLIKNEYPHVSPMSIPRWRFTEILARQFHVHEPCQPNQTKMTLRVFPSSFAVSSGLIVQIIDVIYGHRSHRVSRTNPCVPQNDTMPITASPVRTRDIETQPTQSENETQHLFTFRLNDPSTGERRT